MENLTVKQMREILDLVRWLPEVKSISAVENLLGMKPDSLGTVKREVEKRLGEDLFDTRDRHSGAKALDTPILDSFRQMVTLHDSLMNKGSGKPIRIRVGAGMAASVSLFPEILSYFHRRYPDCQVDLFYGRPDVLMNSYNLGQLDLVLTACDRHFSEHRTDVVANAALPMALVCGIEHPLPVENLSWDNVKDATFVLLSRERVPNVAYPRAIFRLTNARIEYARSLMICHAIVAAGHAVTISPPALISEELRGRLKLAEYSRDPDESNLFHMCLIRSNEIRSGRSDTGRRRLDWLTTAIAARLRDMADSTAIRSMSWTTYHVSRTFLGELCWRMGRAKWNFSWNQRFSGIFSPSPSSLWPTEKKPYRITGYIEKVAGTAKYERLDMQSEAPIQLPIPGQVQHISWCGYRTKSGNIPGEQFSATHFISSEGIIEQGPHVGLWSGRTDASESGTLPRPFASYLIMNSAVSKCTPRELNEMSRKFSSECQLPAFPLPKDESEIVGS